MQLKQILTPLVVGAVGLAANGQGPITPQKTPPTTDVAKSPTSAPQQPTNAELTGRVRMEASIKKPIEFTEAELKERAELIKDFSYLLPTDVDEKKNFMERADKLSNTGLGTLFRGTKDLMKFELIDSNNKETLFRAENLLHSANLVGKAANVYESGKASADRTKGFIFTEMSKLKLVTVDSKPDINEQKLEKK